MGDDTTLPPDTLEYRNVILEYEYNSHVYIYSSDGIPTLISNGTGTNFNNLTNRPKYDGKEMDGLTNIPKVPTSIVDLDDGVRVTTLETEVHNLDDSMNKAEEAINVLSQSYREQATQIGTLTNDVNHLKADKQDKLVSGTTIKTINGISLLGSGNIEINPDAFDLQEKLVSGVNIKTINGQSLLGSGDIEIEAGNAYTKEEADARFATQAMLEDYYTKTEADAKFILYTPYIDGRKTLQLANYDTISGLDTNGVGHNLAMVSKWDVADFGAPGLHMNLNSKDPVTVNDDHIVITDEYALNPTDFDMAWNG